jgi:hypothetical protein
LRGVEEIENAQLQHGFSFRFPIGKGLMKGKSRVGFLLTPCVAGPKENPPKRVWV